MKKIAANAHTHTDFCDGRDSAQAMVEAALTADFHDLGFSGHSYCPFDPEASMNPQQTAAYINEIHRLQRAYQGRLNIHLGIELDYYSQIDLAPYEYIIGSVHYLQDERNGHYYSIDNTPEELGTCIQEMFAGDALALVDHYFNLVVATANSPYTTIIGHFDLIRKLNANQRFFDETSQEYRHIATNALAQAAQSGHIFEINSGAMSRGYTTTPYPATFLLQQLADLGAPITLSSDAHSADTLGYAFATIAESLPAYGFTEVQVLTANGFVAQSL